MDHQTLLEKLKAYNFDEISLAWFMSYLSNRSYRVQIESRRKQPRTTGPYGVPQGSVLGSLLFVISQNDLPNATPDNIDDGQTICFVDDETEQVSDTNPGRLQAKLKLRINNAVTWLADNKMVIAPDKSKLILSMTRELRAVRHPNLNISIQVNNTTIPATPSEKLLGIVISQDLSWTPYLWGEVWRQKNNHQGLVPTLIQRLALLCHLEKYSSKAMMRSFVPAMIISKITYALPLIGSLLGLGGYNTLEPQKTSFRKQDILRLQSIQRTAMIMTLPTSPHLQNQPTIDLLNETGCLSVHQLIAYTTMALTFRIMKSGRPPNLTHIFSNTTHSRTRSSLLTPPRFKLNLSLETFMNQATRLYNEMPDHLKTDAPFEQLKGLVQEWIKLHIRPKV